MADDPISTALTLIPYGFYAISSKHGDDINVMVANWLTQISFSPRLLAFALQKGCYTHGLVEKGRAFGVNIFAQKDSEAVMPFTKSRANAPDKVDALASHPAAETGVPVLDGAAAFFEVRVLAIHDTGGDHDLVVGEVVGAEVNSEPDVKEVLSLTNLGWHYAG